jgi:hypothetical protein
MRCTAIVFAVVATASATYADVTVESATDASPCAPTERLRNSTTLRHTLENLIDAQVSNANAHVDASIVSLTVESTDELVTVSAQVRLAISDDSGKILSVLTGGAKVEMPARDYRARGLGSMRDDAVSAAVEGMFGKVKTALEPTAAGTRWYQLGKLVGDLVAFARPFPRS